MTGPQSIGVVDLEVIHATNAPKDGTAVTCKHSGSHGTGRAAIDFAYHCRTTPTIAKMITTFPIMFLDPTSSHLRLNKLTPARKVCMTLKANNKAHPTRCLGSYLRKQLDSGIIMRRKYINRAMSI